MKGIKILCLLLILGCEKPQEPNIEGAWKTGEIIYEFHYELTITEDGISENYCYRISNDTIYLDYGLPFVIEKLSESRLILSKNYGALKYWYEFVRM